MRKIHEAFVINNLKPPINDKEECISVKRFLVIYLINNFSVVFVFYTCFNDVHTDTLSLFLFIVVSIMINVFRFINFVFSI